MWLILGLIAIVVTVINLSFYAEERIIGLLWRWHYHLQH